MKCPGCNKIIGNDAAKEAHISEHRRDTILKNATRNFKDVFKRLGEW